MKKSIQKDLAKTLLLIFCTVPSLYAQVKIGSNPTTITSNANLDVEASNGTRMVVLKNGNVGIGTSTPSVLLNVVNGNFSVNQGLVNTFGTGVLGAGAIGYNNINNGWYSLSVGTNHIVGGQNSLAVGFKNETSTTGGNAFVYGQESKATAGSAFAGGTNCLASANNSVALGQETKATGESGIALGYQNVASGNNSVALGQNTTASGSSSIAFGFNCTAAGSNSFAFGRQAQAAQNGSFVMSDSYVSNVSSNGDNSFTSRFIGGYTLNTGTDMTTGVKLDPNSSSWASISDVRAKKDIVDIENGLTSVMRLRPKKYHYKNTDEKYFSLGFIAQEVLEILPDVVNVPENKKELLSIRYSEMIPVLTKAIQEQQAEIILLKSQNELLKKEVAKVEALASRLTKMEANLAVTVREEKRSTLEKAK